MPNFLYIFSDLIFTIGVPLAIVGGSAALVSRTELGRALIGRIRSGRVDDVRTEQLAAELEAVRQELVDVQERLDTTELLLRSKRMEPGRIDDGVQDRELRITADQTAPSL
ncbi:MAG: hypothetical protein AMS18_02130 [Gemmatimonas sp. SG8_17]|nr:MAG: hypothetical protein AMS18_02130 [Gemmatimonas sp. SG8_17]